MRINRLSCGILAFAQLAGTCFAVAQTDSGPGGGRQPQVTPVDVKQATVPGAAGTSPAITISARNLDFGLVPVDSNIALSFVIQNVGNRILTGAANVSPPFRILGGSAFVLEPAQTQVITVQYAPSAAGMHMTVVHLTGASVTVVGSAGPRKAPARRQHRPTQPEGQRLLARQ